MKASEHKIKEVILKLVGKTSWNKKYAEGISKKDLQDYLTNVLKSENLLSGIGKEHSFNILKNHYLDIINNPQDYKHISKEDMKKIK